MKKYLIVSLLALTSFSVSAQNLETANMKDEAIITQHCNNFLSNKNLIDTIDMSQHQNLQQLLMEVTFYKEEEDSNGRIFTKNINNFYSQVLEGSIIPLSYTGHTYYPVSITDNVGNPINNTLVTTGTTGNFQLIVNKNNHSEVNLRACISTLELGDVFKVEENLNLAFNSNVIIDLKNNSKMKIRILKL